MKINRFLHFRCLLGVTLSLVSSGLCGAPLTWFPGPSLSVPMSGAATVASGQGNLLIGGDSSYFQSLPQSLTPTNRFWTYLPAIYGTRIAPGAVANGGDVIIYGGSDGTNSTSTVVGYSPSGDSALTLASMSVARSYLGYAPDASGSAYAIGGLDDNGQPLSSVERYNQDSSTWAAISSLPVAQYNFPAVFDRTNGIYIFGGRTNTTVGGETAAVLRYSTKTSSWAAMAPMPVATAGSAAVLGADGKIYVVGGTSGGVTTNVVQVYNPAANSWVISTPLPEALSASAVGVDSLGRLILMGGMNVTGNDVSDVWRSQQLGAPDNAPVFVSYPGVSATYQVPYLSSINATGNPQPIYLVFSGPAGMQVDTYSGAIKWTPQSDQIGSNSVTIRATNYAGFADWNFTIKVPNPPPTSPTNLTVVRVTDNSVTLAWDPESLAVGPVTYSVYLRHFAHSPRGGGGSVWYTQIGSSTTSPSITITGLTTGLSQAYYVAAKAPGGSSDYGPGIVATTTAPQGPPDLFVTGLTPTTVSLAWDPAPGPAQSALYSPITSYTIMERSLSPGPANIPTVTNISGTNGTISGLTPGRSHIWFVSGVDAEGNSSPLGSVYVIVTNPAPVAPLASGGGLLSNGNFQFMVQQGGPAVQALLIQASTNLTDPAAWVQIGSVLPSSGQFSFTDTNAARYSARYYRILAR
jgi:hypothetical protein